MAGVAVWMRGGVLLVCGALSLACVGRTVPDDSDAPMDEDAPEDEDDVEPRPSDGMYAACSASAQCEPLDFCVFPSDEDGYCTDICSTPDDPSRCDASPGGDASTSCLDIGLASGNRVCALDCSGGASCPGGMRCEAIDTNDGERRICF